MTKFLEVFGKLADGIATRDGVFAVLFFILVVFNLYVYFFEIRAIQDRLEDVATRQITACIRSGVQPVELCWAKPPKLKDEAP